MDTSYPPAPEPQPPLDPGVNVRRLTDAEARTWAMWCHLGSLAGFVVPFGNVLAPLIVWQVKKDEHPMIDEHGRESVNAQLSLLIYLCGGGVAAFVLSFICIGILLIPLLGAVWLAGVVFSIIAGVKANEGVLYRYPLILRLLN